MKYILNWAEVSLLPDVRQRALVLNAAMCLLDITAKGHVRTTGEMAKVIGGDDVKVIAAISRILVRLAKKNYFTRYCTHDGEEYIRYGRANVRYRWHGQAKQEEWEI